MDKLAKRLRDDADQITCSVSDELDGRIEASLQGVQVQAVQERVLESRPASFWWTSSLTGVAVAAAIIVAVNMQAPAPISGYLVERCLIQHRSRCRA